MSAQSSAEADDAEEAGEPANASEDAGPPELLKDDMFHLLQNSRRRAVLRYIAEREDPEQFVMRDVAEAVAAWEYNTTVQKLTSDQRQRVYIALYQSHLPKLDEHDVIDYDQNRGVVEPTALTRVFEPYLEDGLHAGSEFVGGEPDTADETKDRESDLTNTVRSLFRI